MRVRSTRSACAYILITLLPGTLIPTPLAAQEMRSREAGARAEAVSTVSAANQKSSLGPRELTGEYVDRPQAEPEGTEGFGEDGIESTPPPLAALPVLDTQLEQKIATLPGDEMLRVIVYLGHLPHDRVAAEVEARHSEERAELEGRVRDVLALSAARRDTALPHDADNLPDLVRSWPAERAALEPLHQQHEALSLTMKNEAAAALKAELAPFVQRVRTEIEARGGEFEFSTIAGSTVVARMPAGWISNLAEHPDVLRVVEDSMLHSDLTIIDDATLVNAAGGLWDSGYDGGIYDPAVIDSGLDLSHPGMVNSVSPLRDNFWTWYLVAANGSANFADIFSADDLQGHGTHVSGIVGSYGTAIYPDHLGLAFGIDKLVTLKAGWLNSSTGGASMFWSDKYNVVDRALYDTGNLQGGSFSDDVDGMNLSYGGSTTSDDTDGGRFWDSVVSTYSDLPVTISAGNSGPNNTNFNDPAVSYNAIAVANANDRGTAGRDDDIINSGSTVGPTAGNRRKPDLAAPGTTINAPNNDWETELDYIDKTGTSMAAPAVLGVIMDLNDAGVFDEKAVKALLINTAQKNEPGINIENDTDGWDPAVGWGLMNAFSAYIHRFDVFQDSVTPRDTGGDYQLYKGVMRDEGPTGEGRDRATMVWNRHATYDTAAAPSTYYSLVDLNLRLYGETSNTLINSDLDGNDNVHQVRIGSGAGDTDVIINAYAWSTTFSHGGATESFALATEESFARVDHPSTFQAVAVWPSSVEPNEEFDIEFWLRNDSEIASHNNTYNLELPAGWTLVSGIDTQNVGSIAGGGGNSTHVNYTVRASGVVGAATVTVAHSHNSYNEPYGDFNWNMGVTVEVDVTPPNPNPMSFATPPAAVNQTSTDMTASIATDLHGPVEYYLDYTSSPTGGIGGSDSSWQTSRDYVDLSLEANQEYCYRAWARDNATFPNNTTPSSISCAFTLIQGAAAPLPGGPTTSSIAVQSQGVFTNLASGISGLLVENTTNGSNSGWFQAPVNWTSLGLMPNTDYTFAARSRNGNGIETPMGPGASIFTLANLPAASTFGTLTHESVTVRWAANGNPAGTEYFVDNITLGTDSGWTTFTEWVDGSTGPSTSYSYLVRARNGDGVETGTAFLGTVSTPFFGDGFETGDMLKWTLTNP